MYQTARMLDITLSRSAFAVCITRLAMRPAKSFWKNGQLWRTTCQWLCQRIRLVAPGISTLWRIEMSTHATSGRATSTRTTIATSSGHCASSAAWRSVASISDTSLPMKSGITVSISGRRQARRRTWPRTSPSSASRSASRTPAALRRRAGHWRYRSCKPFEHFQW